MSDLKIPGPMLPKDEIPPDKRPYFPSVCEELLLLVIIVLVLTAVIGVPLYILELLWNAISGGGGI